MSTAPQSPWLQCLQYLTDRPFSGYGGPGTHPCRWLQIMSQPGYPRPCINMPRKATSHLVPIPGSSRQGQCLKNSTWYACLLGSLDPTRTLLAHTLSNPLGSVISSKPEQLVKPRSARLLCLWSDNVVDGSVFYRAEPFPPFFLLFFIQAAAVINFGIHISCDTDAGGLTIIRRASESCGTLHPVVAQHP